MQESLPYLRHAHVEGFKSIRKADISFKPGLNIIIGKNGAGKTNLMEAIAMAIPYGGEEATFPDAEVKLDFATSHNLFWLDLPAIDLRPSDQPPVFTRDRVLSIGPWEGTRPGRATGHFWNLQLVVYCYFFRHTLDVEIPLIKGEKSNWRIGESMLEDVPRNSSFFASALYRLATSAVLNKLNKTFSSSEKATQEAVSEAIIGVMNAFAQRVLPALRAYTPVTGMKALGGSVLPGTLNGQLVAKGFRFLFEVGGAYQPFENLSDGTKRILILVLELAETERWGLLDAQNSLPLYLIEEPELGIHPHQLHLLLNFLKEQAQTKQIILSTHSPQVLDILDRDELDRIQIASFDRDRGTTFAPLTEPQIEKAQAYMKDEGMYLSDYWRFSDLEPGPIL